MKTFSLILFLSSFFPVVGQVSDDLRLVDEFDPRADCESLERRLDSLFAQTFEDPKAIAYAVIQQGGNVFDNAVVYQKASSYARFRGFPTDRYTVLLTKGNSDIKVALWIGKNGKTPPVVSSNLDLILRNSPSRILIEEDTIEIVKLDGRETYIGTGNPSCLARFDSSLVWELLKANDGFDAEFVVKTKSSKRYRQLVAILKREFLENGATIGRLKFVYGGRDKEIEGGRSKLASVATSFVKSSPK